MGLPFNQTGTRNGVTQFYRATYWLTGAQFSSSAEWIGFDNETDSFGFYSSAGSPEGVVAADIGSFCSDTTNGAMYIKTTDTVATGWELVGAGGDVATSYTCDVGSAVPAANNLNVLGGTGCNTSGSGDTVTINVSGGGFEWIDVTGTSDDIDPNTGYIANNASLVTLTLPASPTVGDCYRVVVKGTGFARIAQNANRTIQLGNEVTTTGVGGYLQATKVGDSIEILCTADDEFYVLSSMGNWDWV